MKKLLFLPIATCLLASCMNRSSPDATPAGGAGERAPVAFDTLVISDSANLWFARAMADLNGDGLQDVALIDNNGFGGPLMLLMGSEAPLWEVRMVAETAPNGGVFSCGDILARDLNGDGTPDILGTQNNGEWTELSKVNTHFLYSWTLEGGPEASFIGSSPAYIKDVESADLNQDGLSDLVSMSFDGEFVQVYTQQADGSWKQSLFQELPGLHEGMALGDVDGDGWTDIAANGYLLHNPRNQSKAWKVSVIDSIWHTQTGDWSRNATKHACADVDGDGKDEVLITHSERSGYPVALYHAPEAEGDPWKKDILMDSLSSAHTLQVGDLDLDGDLDVLTGMNKGRAWNLDIRSFPVYLLLNQGDGSWETQLIDKRGIYNGHLADFEGDGDLDIFRLESHDGKRYELLLNLTR